jgi:two-component system KDP operon response regulator KdpE
MLREIGGGTRVQDAHYLRIVLGKLRQKLGDDPATPRWLKTEPGVGYRLLPGGGWKMVRARLMKNRAPPE